MAGDLSLEVSYMVLCQLYNTSVALGLLGDSQVFFLVILIAGLKSVEDTWDMIFTSSCGEDGFLGRFLNTAFEAVQIGEL